MKQNKTAELDNYLNELKNSISKIKSVASDNKYHRSIFFDAAEQFFDYATRINNKDGLTSLEETNHKIERLSLGVNLILENAANAKESLDKLLVLIKNEKDEVNNKKMPLSEYFDYLQKWQKNGMSIKSDSGYCDLHEVEEIVNHNDHMLITDLKSFLNVLSKNGCYFWVYRDYPGYYAKEEFYIKSEQLVKYRDNWNGLMAEMHEVHIDTYLDWLDQVTNPRCRSLNAQGLPCQTLAIKQAKSPKEFSSPEHTCCRLHRESELEGSFLYEKKHQKYA